jgi:hypothetical protein
MHGRLHAECCFTPSWPALLTSEGLLHDPADDAAWAAQYGQAHQETLEKKCFGSAGCSVTYQIQAQLRRDTGAELILIILLLAGGIIYASFASNPMSFDDLIELRFLPSRRRNRDPE